MSSPESEVVVYDDSHINLIYCHIHDCFEVMRPDAYQVCFECKHVYNTAEDLEEAYTRVVSEMNRNAEAWGNSILPVHRPADQIFFCQECIHDF